MPKPENELHITISNRTLLRVIAFLLGTFLLIRFVDNVRHPLTLIFVSFFLALALNPAVSWISRKLRMKSRAGATAIAYGMVLAVLIGFMALIIPPLVNQTSRFVRDFPATLSNLETQDSAVGRFVRRYELGDKIDDVAADWTNRIGDVRGPVLTTANRVVGTIVSIVTVLVLTFMMLVEGHRWLNWLFASMPEKKARHAKAIATRMYKAVSGFVNGQLLLAVIAGSFALVALVIATSVLDVSVNIVAMAAIVTLFALIPTIGNIISAILVTLLCLFVSTPLAIVILIYFIVYQQIENATIQPYIQSRQNELTALTVFMAVLLGIGLGGFLGGLVAIPIASCLKILFDDWMDDRRLNASTIPAKKS